jgi:hypothetical protein
MVMKYLLFCLMTIPVAVLAQSNTLTIQECYNLAEKNYPLVKQRSLVALTKQYSLENLSKGNYPQLSINGQATYQSDVTSIPVNIPGQEIPQLSKDQYRLSAELSQSLSESVTISRQKEVQEIASQVQEQALEVELYKIRDRVSQLFFGTLLLNEQLQQNDLLINDIQLGIDRTSALVNNGSEFQSSLDKLKAEALKANQRTIELQTSRRAFLDMLGLFINASIADETALAKPQPTALEEEIQRPELILYQYQRQSYDVQNRLINSRNIPRLSVFLQGGVGRPTPVNALSNDLKSYYIGGLRLNWNLSSFYTTSNEKQLLQINKRMIDSQEETFLFNTNVTLKQQNGEISKLQRLVQTDEEIINLRNSVSEAAKAQLDNGVITVNDYLKEINAEDQARQNKLLHEIQLLQAYYIHQNTTGHN